MRVLVTAASRHGATAEIATMIGQAMTEVGFEAEVKPIRSLDGVAGYSAVVLGSSVYLGRWLPEATEFVQRHVFELGARPVWLFSSGPTGNSDPTPEDDPVGIAELASSIHARGHRVFRGRLDQRHLGLVERFMIRAAHVPVGDFREPSEVTAWVREIAAELDRVAVAIAG